VLARNDVAARKHEGLAEEVRLLHGVRPVDPVTIVEGGVRHVVRPFDGHKTGFYLDQRPARALVASLAKGKRVLDLFAYQGAFSLAMRWPAGRVGPRRRPVEPARCELASAGATANRLTGSDHALRRTCSTSCARSARRNAAYDLIVLDPPAFAKSRREIEGAERGYRDLNRQALRLLAPHGFLLTCTCSHHITLLRFEEVVRQAAAGLPFQRAAAAAARGRPRPSGADHAPESEYLKVLLLQRQDSLA
jgi:23S rRNA (cytosine1962-C5)-methyltransferase